MDLGQSVPDPLRVEMLWLQKKWFVEDGEGLKAEILATWRPPPWLQWESKTILFEEEYYSQSNHHETCPQSLGARNQHR